MTQDKRSAIKSDVVVIGAGASGLMCAIEAGKRSRSVLVLEHTNKMGKKIRVSGGGHCNFTNIDLTSDNYLSGNPHFCKSALARFTPYDFIARIERHGIEYYEKGKGQLFCRRTSGDIITMLHQECRSAGIEFLFNCKIGNITKGDNFFVSTNSARVEAHSLVVATGGLSYPDLGATDAGFRIADSFGIRVTPLRPALVPLLFSLRDMKIYSELSGVSFNASVRCKGGEFRGEILFTHRGLSGPVVLEASSYWTAGDELIINLMPDMDPYELLVSRRGSRIELCNLLSEFLPRRFVRRWCEFNAPSRPVCQYTEQERKDIAHRLRRWTIRPKDTEGYGRAEITAGGIDTGELSSKTMEAKKVPGLFFVGEVVDVAGQLGGYNLQWAWSSGFVAGQYA